MNANGQNYQLVNEMKLLRSIAMTEDEGGGAAPAAPAPSTATTASAIAPLEKRLTVKIKRREWKKPKFQNPNTDTKQ
jgi:hypothetical protein